MLSLFGSASYHDELLTLNKPSILLIYLAHQADWVSRDELAFLLKPDDDEKTAKNYVRVLLHRTKNIALAPTLELDKDKLKLLVKTDTDAFKEAISKNQNDVALDLYKGEFLKGFNALSASEFEDWVFTEREHYAQLFLDTLNRYLESSSVSHEKAIEYLEKAFEVEPYDENWRLSYCRHLVLSGQTIKAQTAFESFKQLLKDDLEVTISPSFEQDIQEVLEQTQEQINSISTFSNAKKVILPRSKAGFIGRQHELELVNKLFLEKHFPLVTLVGLGGSGKTSLAIEVGHTLRAEFEQTYFIDLSEAVTNQDFKNAVVTAIDTDLLAKPDVWQAFKDLLHRKTLLIFDNCEQLEDISLVINDLIDNHYGLSLLATSRQALNLSKEYLLDISGLELPPNPLTTTIKTVEDLTNYSAAALFCQSVEQVHHAYHWTDEAIAAVINICRLTDGMPLALELAASWSRLLSLVDIEVELGSSLDLLQSEQADTNERHQSIRTVFQSSFEKLNQQEQQTLLTLSLFQGGWTIPAAKQITGAHLPLLLNLSKKSLIQRRSNTRFGMHMLLRQYLEEAAKSHSGFDSWKSKHSEYYIDYLIHIGSHQLIEIVNADFENIKTAWLYRIQTNFETQFQTTIQALHKLYTFLETSGRSNEGIALIQISIQELESDRSNKNKQSAQCILAYLYAELAYLQVEQGASVEATLSLNKALDSLPKSKQYREERADCYMKFSFTHYRLGSIEKRLDYAKLAVKDLEELGSDHYAMGLRHLAGAYHSSGNIEEAKLCFEKSIELLENLQHNLEDGKRQLGISLLSYGFLYQGQFSNNHTDETDKAIALYLRAQEQFEAVNFHKGLASFYNNLALIQLNQQDFESAKHSCTQALHLSQKIGNVNLEVYCYMGFARIMVTSESFPTPDAKTQVLNFLDKAQSLTQKHNLPNWPLIAIQYATLYYHLDKPERAAEIFAIIYNDETTPPISREAVVKAIDELGLDFPVDSSSSGGLCSLDELLPTLGSDLA